MQFSHLSAGIRILSGLTISLVIRTLPAAAAPASAWSDTSQSQVRLVAAVDSVGPGSTLELGLQFRLEPGWKIYWRSPGDAGVPPVLRWTGSENLATAEVRWPAPHRFNLYGLDTFGYSDEVVLPIRLAPAAPGQPVRLKLALSYGICKDVCIPYAATLQLALPAGAGAGSPFAALIRRYQDLVPRTGPVPDLALGQVDIKRGEGAATLVVTATSTVPFGEPDLLVEGPDGAHFAKPQVRLGQDGHAARFRSTIDLADMPKTAGETRLVLTLIDGRRAIERQVTVPPLR